MSGLGRASAAAGAAARDDAAELGAIVPAEPTPTACTPGRGTRFTDRAVAAGPWGGSWRVRGNADTADSGPTKPTVGLAPLPSRD